MTNPDVRKTEEMLAEMEKRQEKLLSAKADHYLNNLYDFNKDVMGWPDLDESFHKPLCEFVEQKTPPKKLVLLPRGHLKSSVITVGYSCQQIAKDPSIRILIVNATYEMACTFLSQIKKTLQYNQKFRQLYGAFDQNASKWGKDMIMVPKVESEAEYLKKEPTVTAWGIGGNLVSQHYDMVILDDIVARDNVNTKEQIEKVVLTYKDVLDLLEPNHPLIIIGTRWNDADLYGWIMDPKNGVGQDFAVKVERAYTGNLETGEDLEILFPKKFSRTHLLELKRQKGIYEFSGQYLNDPVPSESATFRRDWFKYYEQRDLSGTKLNTFTLIDPAVSIKEQADYTAIVTVGIDRYNNLYILDIVRKKLQPMELIDEIFRNWEQWHPMKMGIEAISFAKTIKPFAEAEMQRRQLFIPLEELKAPKHLIGKDLRIRSLQPYYYRGQIYHKQSLAYNDDLEDELMRFPRGRHDDIIDALSYFPLIAFPPKRRGGAKRKNRFLY